MKKEAVLHINTEDFIYPVERNRLTVRLRAARDDLTKCLIVYFSRTTPDQKKDCQLVKLYSDDLFDYYEANIEFSKVARYQKYFFVLSDNSGETLYYSATGFGKGVA